MDDHITTSVVVDDGGRSGPGHVTVLALSWLSSDPLAIQLKLSPKPEHPSLPRGEWVVLRDFLRYGCSEPTGDGAVRIRPAEGNRVHLELRDESKVHGVTVPLVVVESFLDETERAVPAGQEAGKAELDALIDRLLER